MQCEDKLGEARFFLRKLEFTPQDAGHDTEFMYLLSAFLSSWRSVTDVMLYDFADKFHLGFSRDEPITDHDLEIAARAASNAQASQFVVWFKQQLGTLGNNPLSRKRNIIVHRGYPEMMHVHSVYVADSMALSSSFYLSNPQINAPVTMAQGAEAGTGGGAIPTAAAVPGTGEPLTTPQPTTAQTTTVTRTELRFQDRQDMSAVAYCQQAFTQMETVVNSALAQFGR